MSLEFPKRIQISLRFWHDLLLMLAYALESDKEVGGLVIKAQHGHLGVIAEQFGEGREIVLEPNEEMYEGEVYYGTVHVHPITEVFSSGDVASYLADPSEKVMTLMGSDGSLNIAIKIPQVTKEGNIDQIRKELDTNYPAHEVEGGQSPFQQGLDKVAADYGFLWYKSVESDENVLTLQNKELLGAPVKTKDVVDDVEDLVDTLGIQGSTEFPENYKTKKTPPKKEISRCKGCKRGEHCYSKEPGCECGCKEFQPQYDIRTRDPSLPPLPKEETMQQPSEADMKMEKCPYCETFLPHYKLWGDKGHVYGVHGRYSEEQHDPNETIYVCDECSNPNPYYSVDAIRAHLLDIHIPYHIDEHYTEMKQKDWDEFQADAGIPPNAEEGSDLRDPSTWLDYIGVELMHNHSSEDISSKWKKAINYNPAQDKILADQFNDIKWQVMNSIDSLVDTDEPEEIQRIIDVMKGQK
jgi:hypothetical protein